MNRAERRARRSKKRGQYRGLKRLSGDSTFGSIGLGLLIGCCSGGSCMFWCATAISSALTFTLPSWSGSKNLHIKYRVWDTSSEARIHNGMYGADGLIKIYRRTYSVM